MFFFCIITEDREEKTSGRTYFPDFAPMLYGELMLLFITCIWYVYLFQFVAWLPLLKSIFPTLTCKFAEKQQLGEKFARNVFKASMQKQK